MHNLPTPEVPGSRIVNGRWAVVRELGRGAQGAVWLVRDRDTGDEVVLKTVAVAESAEAARALIGEFAHLTRVADPALPRARDLGVAETGPLPPGTVFFTAERVEGVPLLEAMAAAEGRERARLLWSVARDVAGALAAIHAAGLLHHDVTPANVLVGGAGAAVRATLVDLGLATPNRGALDARGTPTYLAPEALAGGADARSDLYALGATLYHAAAGRPPFEGPDLGATIAAIVTAPVPPVPRVPAPLGRILTRLLAKDAADRFASAVALARALDDIAAAITPPVRPRPAITVRAAIAEPGLVGAGPAIARVAAALDGAGAPVRVTGPHGARVGDVIGAAIRRHQLERAMRSAPAAAIVRGRLDDVAAALDAAPTVAGLVAALAHPRPGVDVAVVDVTGDDRAIALARTAAAAGGAGAIRLVVGHETDDAPPEIAGLETVTLPRLGVAQIGALAGEMLGEPVTEAWARALHRAADGLPALAAEIVRAVAARGGDPLAIDPATVAADADAVAQAAAARVDELPPGERARVRALAIREHALEPRIAAAIRARIPAEERRRLHAEAAAAARAAKLDAVAIAPHLVGAGDPDAPRVAAEAAELLLARGQPRRARELAEAAGATLLVARAASDLGDHAAAREHALAAAARLTGDARARARLVAARAAQRSGDLATAARELGELLDDARDPALRGEIHGARARILVAEGRHREALDEAARGEGRACLEAAGLAAFYLGDLAAAEARFGALERLADGDPALEGRAAALTAMVALQRGDLAAATALQRRAGDAARAAGDFHAAAVADLNLATALAERGRHGEALPVLARASAALDALGVEGERAAAEFNRGNSLLAVGDVAGAEAAAHAARAAAPAGSDVARYARLLEGDVARRRGDLVAAGAAYAEAGDGARGHVRLCALAAAAELAIAEAAPEVARRLADEAVPLAGSADDRARLAAVRAAAARLDGAGLAEAVTAATRAARDALAAGRADRAWRTLAIAAEAGGDAALAREAAEIRRALVAATPEAWRARLDDDPDARRLRQIAPPAPPRPAAPRGSMYSEPALEIARLRRLLALSRRLNAEHSLDRLLDDVIDAAIEMTEAERGFLLLRPAPGQPLEPVVARNFAAGALDDAAGKVSRSIAERAATTGEPVITVDAGVDERFGGATSVSSMRLRSVMAVPLRQKGRITGCIYVDHRLRDGAFDDRAAGLALDLADIAAVAIENTRLAADLRRRQDENDALATRLAAELDDRDAELTRVRAQLPGRGALRHRYEQIVGESPATVAMLDIVDRAARTELPVVVVGESGTGKELVARALHDHGARKDRPFVAVNCSAMPEPLLESELFGHVRGAFTGADRDRRGLFEVADGGTLFLDEVADTTPAMQAKLLRVLQDGQIRRVGDDRVRKVDVRVIAASQRSLAELVAQGRFREDLRYRLEVIQVVVPPLRERLEDVPALVEHLLARVAGKLAGGATPTVTRAALRALAQHGWPGNVRELENAIARACALGGPVIDVEDLPEAVARGRMTAPSATGPGADLTLKPALDALERTYVDAAMARARGNQTVAARLLGLSRFGLQKKLKRLAD